ncbi:MAG: excinuclease ABC subunit A, partial [Planctomycetota bacterium]
MTSSPTKPSGRQSGSTAKPRKRRSKTIQESPRLEPIRVRGCRVHNLQGFDVDIPRNQLTVLCGLSGSGKTSLALDTLYAEGQRCYIESFSAYTRQYLDRLDKPDCDAIENIPPAIAVTRASAVSTNRATVATATEIADHVRLLFSKAATLSCHQCGAVVRADSPQSVAESLAGSAGSLAQNGHDAAKRGLIGFEVHLPNPADASEILLALQQDGYLRLIVQGETFQLAEDDRKRLAKQIGRKGADALIVVDRLSTDGEVARWTESLETAMDEGNGRALVLIEADETPGSDAHLPTATVDGRPFTTRAVSDRRRCERCDLDFAEPVPRLFNFNHPLGACPTCEGFGDILAVDEDRVVPDPDRSLAEGAIAPWNTPAYRHELDELLELAPEYELPVHVPYRKLTKKQRRIVWRGVRERNFGGLDGFFGWLDRKKYKMHIRVFAARYRSYKQCPDCCGARLREDVLAYRVGGRNVAEFLAMQADEALSFLNTWMSGEPDDGQTGQQADRLSETIARYESPYSKLDSVGTEDLVRERSIASEPVRQIRHRLEYLQRVGLGYLQLNRPLRTLSGGETQRIALTSALSSTLINMLYVLDEPTAGLHPEDVHRLSDAILDLRDRGNTVLVVEHNPRLIGLADHVIEIGPGAGPCGGRLTFSGTPQGLIDQTNGLTGPFVLAERSHGDAPAKPKPNARDRRGAIVLRGCTGNNLQ